ncbi:MAG: NTPase [Blastocatellia bacterium]|nr:NTPase [Blastocatellia bacterium]MCS7157779.1 NTPase [Blastocatellia bacterium]MCX7753292.1 NTPase [Blastocatellia bacterium]MDW8168145.1 NTPase [Acidobacteriota bacterium]MDW8257607.1 NTPase [Acidobacteriota bacterium]
MPTVSPTRRHLLITGRPGVGKTTLLRQVAERLVPQAAGFYTLEVRDAAGHRVGFEIVTLEGQRRLLAHVDFQTPYRVSRYGVDVRAMEEVAVPVLERGLTDEAIPFLIVDEIARMELFSHAFVRVLDKILISPKRLIATIQQSSHPVIERIRARPDVELWELTPTNRSELLARLLERLCIR